VDYYFLGDEELVTAFRFIGIEGMAVKDQQEAVDVFTRITEGKGENTDSCRVLIMTEETAAWLGENMINWQLSGRYPLLVEIPGISGKHLARKTLVEQIREAIGIHV
jgi:V/A-type H+-transporting ATPase subunit F